MAPKGETTHYDLRVAIAPSNHVRCARRQATEDRGVSCIKNFLLNFGPILRASPSSFQRKEPNVTYLFFVSPVPQDVEQKRKMTSRDAGSLTSNVYLLSSFHSERLIQVAHDFFISFFLIPFFQFFHNVVEINAGVFPEDEEVVEEVAGFVDNFFFIFVLVGNNDF